MSDWTSVSSSVPQGLVLGPTMFLLYINDIDYGVAGSILKFADDTKIFYKVSCPEAAFTLQEDLQKLFIWSKEWQILFNSDKYGRMHIGQKNLNYDYFMGDHRIKSTDKKKIPGSLDFQQFENQFALPICCEESK